MTPHHDVIAAFYQLIIDVQHDATEIMWDGDIFYFDSMSARDYRFGTTTRDIMECIETICATMDYEPFSLRMT